MNNLPELTADYRQSKRHLAAINKARDLYPDQVPDVMAELNRSRAKLMNAVRAWTTIFYPDGVPKREATL